MSEEDDELLDSQTQEEEEIVPVEEPEEESEGDDEDPAAKIADLEDKNRKLFERAKKAEGFVKDSGGNWIKKAKSEAKETNQSTNSAQIDPDELKLIAKGLSDDEIAQAKVIAKGKGVNLTEAVKDPLFEIFQKDLKEKERKENAKLGASKGSSQAQEKAFKSGMTPDEHKALWKQKMGA